MARHSTVKQVSVTGTNENGSNGPDSMYVVELYQDGDLVEERQLPGKSRYYAEDVSENWDTGIIKL